jgi:hypothetical protein
MALGKSAAGAEGGCVSHQQFYETVQREQEWIEEYEQARKEADAARLAAIVEKWPQLKSWPGKEKQSPVLSSGINAVKDSAQRNEL